MHRFLGLPLVAVACAAAQEPAREAAAPVRTDPAPAAPAETRSGAPDAAAHPTSSPTESDGTPAPLRAGTGGGYAPAGRAPAKKPECAPDGVRKKLEQVVGECKKASERICGELKVRASDDGKSVRVTLDVTKQSFDDPFSQCVTSRLNAVEWQCSLPGSDVRLDLGCEL